MMLLKYEDFINRVEELGFMPFSGLIDGMPSLVCETPQRIWHTGDPETDPWCWKDRAAEEKRLAFGCILGGSKGFAAPQLYPALLTACKPEQSMVERYADGLVSQTVMDLWKLFRERRVLDTSEIRSRMGVTRKKGCGRVDSATAELQKQFFITVAGSRQKLDKYGRPYGWHINIYEMVEDWVPKEWFGAKIPLDREEAADIILDAGTSMGNGISREKLAKVLGIV